VALAALCKLRQNNTIQPGARVVVISTAHGLKFSGFKSGYHEGGLPLVNSDHANPPLQLPANAAAVRAALDSRLASPPAARPRV
jgi:threonine synthase